MTQNSTILRPIIALYEPDIPQNTAALSRPNNIVSSELNLNLV